MRQSYCVNHWYEVQCCNVIVFVIKLGFCINCICQGGRVFAFSWLVCMSAVSHKSFPWMSTKLFWGTCHETRNNRLDHWVMWFWIWEFFYFVQHCSTCMLILKMASLYLCSVLQLWSGLTEVCTLWVLSGTNICSYWRYLMVQRGTHSYV